MIRDSQDRKLLRPRRKRGAGITGENASTSFKILITLLAARSAENETKRIIKQRYPAKKKIVKQKDQWILGPATD
jgi:hypothetical protein